MSIQKNTDPSPIIERLIDEMRRTIDRLKDTSLFCIPKHTWKSIIRTAFLAITTGLLTVVAVKVAQDVGVIEIVADWLAKTIRSWIAGIAAFLATHLQS